MKPLMLVTLMFVAPTSAAAASVVAAPWAVPTAVIVAVSCPALIVSGWPTPRPLTLATWTLAGPGRERGATAVVLAVRAGI